MLSMKSRLIRVDWWIWRVEAGVLAFLMAAMTAITFTQVVLRYAFNSPLPWSEELAGYLFVWISMVGAGAAMRWGSHFGLDIVFRRLSPAPRWIVGTIITFAVGAFSVMLLIQGIRETVLASGHVSSSLQIRMFWFYAALPTGAFLMLWHLAVRLFVLGLDAHPNEALPGPQEAADASKVS